MSAWSVLTRVILSIALVLNGAVGVYAATSMQMSHASAANTAHEVEKVSAVAPCHEASGMSHLGPAVDPAPKASEHSSVDCCKAASCTCMCVHGVQVPAVDAAMSTMFATHGQSLRPLLLGHSAPALPHPTRPPIG